MLSERNDAEGAIELFDAAAPRVGEVDALNVGFFNNYANALRRGKRYEQAEVMLRRIVGVDSRNWHAWHNLGQVLKDLRAVRRGHRSAAARGHARARARAEPRRAR